MVETPSRPIQLHLPSPTVTLRVSWHPSVSLCSRVLYLIRTVINVLPSVPFFQRSRHIMERRTCKTKLLGKKHCLIVIFCSNRYMINSAKMLVWPCFHTKCRSTRWESVSAAWTQCLDCSPSIACCCCVTCYLYRSSDRCMMVVARISVFVFLSVKAQMFIFLLGNMSIRKCNVSSCLKCMPVKHRYLQGVDKWKTIIPTFNIL